MSAPITLVCVANPSAYVGARSGVPAFHEQLASDPRIELHHVPADELGGDDWLPARRVPASFAAADFGRLDGLAVTPLPTRAIDLVLCRTLKPLPPGYMPRLEALGERLRFVNEPGGITRHLDLDFAWSVIAPHAPPSVVVHTVDAGEAFARAHSSFVVKRGNSCGGKGVYRVRRAKEGLVVDGLKLEPLR